MMMERSEEGYQRVGTQANRQGSQPMLESSVRMRAATGGSADMNVNRGGPHILLFERDQQLTTLLTSEFQLAGYECHPARTAVEVFDAIARYPIRLVLVNLAQAAASRREFWVALDAQRRGRGIQVFTFRCMNIAGYGADDSEDTSRTVLTDMEVDGMMGVMNLVDAVRSRIPGSTTASFSRVTAIPGTDAQGAADPNKLKMAADVGEPAVTSQSTSPLSMPSINPSLAVPPAPSTVSAGSVKSVEMNKPGKPASGFTDKIRAVIYPSSRSFSPIPETNWMPHNPQNLAATQHAAGGSDAPVRPQGTQSSRESGTPMTDRDARPQWQQSGGIGSTRRQPGQNLQSSPESVSPVIQPQEQESGLVQLSRMVHENHLSNNSEVAGLEMRTSPTSPLTQQQEARQARPVDTTSFSSLPLRASPIQDIPIGREQEYRGGQTAAQSPRSVNTGAMETGTTVERSDVAPAPPVSSPSSITISSSKETVSPGETVTDLEHAEEKSSASGAEGKDVTAPALAEKLQTSEMQTLNQPLPADTTSDDTLLNIVRSLPPMSSLPTPTQLKTPVLSGRATRSLGNVLLEGHLVPQHRLEVAQNIQRMLHGVDMNYQLGEILLMFKLLTPDQLLAASLVSYGLISTAHISALGRIRQELHAIGLEYDLESLLVLFRILTPEELREVRASWMG